MPPAMQSDFVQVLNKMLGSDVDISVMKSFYSTN
jgi:hypothetical protein